jgi:Family of unknown function (DUF6516)
LNLLLETYFQEIQGLIAHCEIVRSSNLVYEVRSRDRGFLRGELRFENNSVLGVREFVKVTPEVVREMYAYQYMNAENALIFRYDNTGHHKKLNLPTFPHHKHEGREDRVIAAIAPTLAEVLQEIASLLG